MWMTNDLDLTALHVLVRERHGLDLTAYNHESLLRRLQVATARLGICSFSELVELVSDRGFFFRMLDDLTVHVTEMFRDPDFYRVLREQAVPVLRGYPRLHVWSAGCASGQEAYALAILLAEEGLYERSQIYATDVSARCIAQAKSGLYPARHVSLFTQNYHQAGGRQSFGQYYTAHNGHLVMRESLRRNIVFFQHDLIGDAIFGAMHLIVCRNVLIYFTPERRSAVVTKLGAGLRHGAFLCLGSCERVSPATVHPEARAFADEGRIYRRLGGLR